MAKARGLGRGLESLIPVPPAAERDAPVREAANGLLEIRVDRIVPNPFQPRRHFDAEKQEELARSIEKNGLIEPLVVRRRADDGSYELVAGERRLRAIRDVLRRETAPAVLRQYTDEEVQVIALVENLQREDLNPIEEAAAYQELHQRLGMTHEAIAERLQVSRPKITNSIRLLELPAEIRQFVAAGELAAGSARALLGLSNPVTQLKLAKRAIAESMSTRAVERLAADAQKGGKTGAGQAQEKVLPPHVADLEERLRTHFGTKVTVEDSAGKGRIVIEYYSVDEAQRILDRMGLPPEE